MDRSTGLRLALLPLLLLAFVLALAGCETHEKTFVAHGQLDERQYALDYLERVSVLPDSPGVEVWRDGRALGTTPLVVDGATGRVVVDEWGFYAQRVTERQTPLTVFDFDWLFRHRHDEPSDPGPSANVLERMRAQEERERRAQERRDNDSEIQVAVGPVEREAERDSPTAWEGGRSYRVEAEAVTLELRHPDGGVSSVSWRPDAEDPAVASALSALTWNDERRRPRSVTVTRVVDATAR